MKFLLVFSHIPKKQLKAAKQIQAKLKTYSTFHLTLFPYHISIWFRFDRQMNTELSG